MDATARKQRVITSDRVDPTKPAAIIINGRFQGLTRFCELTGYPTSTAWGWIERGFIPPLWHGKSTHPHIMKVAADNDIEMDPTDFVEKPANDSSRASPPPGPGDSAAAAPASNGEGLPPPAAAAHPVASDA